MEDSPVVFIIVILIAIIGAVAAALFVVLGLLGLIGAASGFAPSGSDAEALIPALSAMFGK